MDYFDRYCWRCGARAEPDSKGRVLCAQCRFHVAIGSLPTPGSSHPMEWYLTHCWHCEEAEVSPQDDLGLCPSCLDLMAGRRAS